MAGSTARQRREDSGADREGRGVRQIHGVRLAGPRRRTTPVGGPGSSDQCCAVRLALLASDFEQVGSPLGTVAVKRRRTAVPATGASDRLRLVLVLVDDVLEGLDGGRGLHGRATVHSDSCAVGTLPRDAAGGPLILLDLALFRHLARVPRRMI